MNKEVAIIEGPSLALLCKSLFTHGSSKQVLEFTLEGHKVKAYAYGACDTGTMDVGAKSQVYQMDLNFHSLTGRGHGRATAMYFIDTEKWGRWTYLSDD